jgi:hypothetical protein
MTLHASTRQLILAAVRTDRRRRVWLASLIVPFALIIGLRSAWALYTCAAPGGMHAHCCSAKHAHHAAGPQAQLRSACCRGAEPASLTAAADVREPDRPASDAAVAIAVAVPIVAAPVRVAVAAPARTSARPPPVATFLIKQALLR